MAKDMEQLQTLRENNRLEVKKARGGIPNSIWETYSSFANTEGGTIILGVEETASGSLSVVGVPDATRQVKTLWNILNNPQKTNRNILTEGDIHIEKVEDKDLIYLEIPRAARRDKPIYVNGNVGTGTFRRNGDGDYHCTPDEIRNMIRDAGSESADLQVLDEFSMDALCMDTVAKYRRRLALLKPDLPWNQLSDTQLLYRLNAIGRCGKDPDFHPTAAGLLMFGYQYEIVKEFPFYLLDYREQRDETTRWTDRVVSDAGTWSGNLYDFYFLVAERMMVGIKTPFAMEGISRIDDTPVHKAVREALVNALVHANYHERRGVVVIGKRNAFAFANPGILRIDKEEAIAGGFSDPRNATIFTMFTLVNIGERAGSGLSNIVAIWKRQRWQEPQLIESFNPERTTLTLVMSKTADRKPPIESADRKPPIHHRKTERQRQDILAYTRENETCTNTDIRTILGLGETRVKDLLHQMVEEGLLVAEGTNKNRRYRIRRSEDDTP